MKKLLYLHGFASSGASGTVEILRRAFLGGKDEERISVIAPDIPVDPLDALPMIKSLAEREQPSLIVGTSMGAMYAQQLNGFERICVNPCFALSSKYDILSVGKHKWLNRRKDGATEFHVTKDTVRHFREMEEHQFDNWKAGAPENLLCMGLFGTEDTTVNCREEFQRYYPNVQTFEGGHRMNQKVLKNVVMPLIKRLEKNGRKV